MREYIIPNWHAILIHTPLGLLSVGIIMELFGFIWRRSTARVAARWMILVGVVCAVPAATSGIYAYFDACKVVTDVHENTDFGSKWSEVKGEAGGEKIFTDEYAKKGLENAADMLKHHIIQTSCATAIIFLVVILWIALSDRWRSRLYIPLLLLLLAGKGLLIYGAHHGGLAVYSYGVAQEPPQKMMTVKPTLEEMLRSYAPPAQVHVTFAGFMLSLALVALALSIRKMCQPVATGDETWYREHQGGVMGDEVSDAVGLNPDVPATAPGAHNEYLDETRPAYDVSAPTREPPVEVRRPATVVTTPATGATPSTVTVTVPTGVHEVRIPTSRFWVLSLLCALVAFGSGLWIVEFYTSRDKGAMLRSLFTDDYQRHMYHAWVGSSILLLTVLLAFFSLAARRMRWVVATLSLLLLLAISAEIWLGILLMYDGPKGSYKNFTPESKGKKDESRLVVPGEMGRVG